MPDALRVVALVVWFIGLEAFIASIQVWLMSDMKWWVCFAADSTASVLIVIVYVLWSHAIYGAWK